MIGLDTSHVVAFSRLFNRAAPSSELSGIRVVAGYRGGTDLPASRDRVDKFTEQVRSIGVQIVDAIPALLARVDVVLLESVDARIHLAEAIQVIEAGKPLFIDKPMAGSLAEAVVIFDLARKHGVPCFSTSSLRFASSTQNLRADPRVGQIVGAATWGPCEIQAGIPDLFFYGIHGIETLFALMGTGCVSVARIGSRDTDQLTGLWDDGRIGTYRRIRGAAAKFGAMAFGRQGVVQIENDGGYENLCRELVRFFRTGQPPVTAEETLEILAFMEAADESRRQNGTPVLLADAMAKAREEAPARLDEAKKRLATQRPVPRSPSPSIP